MNLPIRAKRRIDGISAVLLPFDREGSPDFDEFQSHIIRTQRAGLRPAVNMDTGFGPQISPEQRRAVLGLTRETLGPGTPFVAGAQPFGEPGDALAGYRSSVEAILKAGAVPVVFPSEFLASKDGPDVARLIGEIAAPAPQALAFELGGQFVPFGRIYDLDTFKRIMEIPRIVGLKHSSLNRRAEFERLALRDSTRPDFRIYTGNDLGIDMIMYGSDYLLGLSTFDPEAFGVRDRMWEKGDEAFYDLNDALQALGSVGFREPVPAYKHSAAIYLKLTGAMQDPFPHPACPRRPAWEAELLAPLAARVAEAKASGR